MANKVFWGGNTMGFGGIKPVHMTIIPESFARARERQSHRRIVQPQLRREHEPVAQRGCPIDSVRHRQTVGSQTWARRVRGEHPVHGEDAQFVSCAHVDSDGPADAPPRQE
ncbi:hypothetical protein OF83DRAFT_1171843 [Amylostereum chailletii]|nr:hypothetical protein OF83DRAFT_1171843 [Amylostereum chailletii]